MPRLKTRAQFQSVLAHATCARTSHFALHVLPLDAAFRAGDAVVTSEGETPALAALFPGGGVWLGAMTPKRWARRAVTRNAIRRQIYALTLAEGAPPAGPAHVAWVVRLRAEFSRKTFVSASSDALRQAVRAELRVLWSRAVMP
ncbi:MAG: ribonuclease P protein component [Comamonas sp.]